MMRVLLAVCLLAAFSAALAYGQTSFITLDTIPNSAHVGDMVTFTGTLHLGGRSPEGAVVYIRDEDPFGGDDLLASAYVGSDGRFTARWIVEDVDPDVWADVYAVFEGDYASPSAKSPEQKMAVLTYGGSLVLDTIPESAVFGESVTMSGTLYLGGHNPEGAVVYIRDEDQFSGDDLLASAYVGSDGRFTAYWIAEDIDPTGNMRVYAVFEGNDRFNRLVSDMHDMYVYFDSPVPDPTPPAGGGYMKLYYSMDLERSPRVLIAPSPSSYDEVRKHIIPVQEGIIELTAMLEREYEEGIWDVSFEVLDRGRPFASEEPDIVVSIVTDEEDPQCDVDYGVAWPDNAKPVQVRVCSLERYSDAEVNAIAAHEFIHAIGLGHTFDIAGDMMCSEENDVPTCDDLDSKSNTPSSLNLAAIVAVYGTDGFSNPNNVIVWDETFTLVDYQNRNHLRLPQGQDYPTEEYPAGYIFADRWQYGPGEEVFLDGFHFGEHEGEATVTIEYPHGNTVDVFGVSVVDGYFSVYAGGYHLPGTYTARSYDHRGDFVAGTTFDVTENIPEGSDGWLVLTDAGQYYSGSTMQISGYGPQSDHGPSRVLIVDQDGSVVDDLSVYPAAGHFTVTAYLGNSYQPGTYGVWLYDGADALITYTSFTLTVSGKDAGAIVLNPVGTSVPGCEETDECFIPILAASRIRQIA